MINWFTLLALTEIRMTGENFANNMATHSLVPYVTSDPFY